MDLELIYKNLEKIISNIDFSRLWKNFTPLKFAIYNETECFFDGNYIEKTDEFIANTSIKYNGEFIAIYNVSEDEDIEILASLIIHEMFHAFQNINHESRFANELEAIFTYKYSTENLSIKHEENLLIASLIKNFNRTDFQKLISYRKYRHTHFTYEYEYEVAIEQIEGTARFVELNALQQISKEKYEFTLNKMIENICNCNMLFPIRIVSYSIGALFFKILKDNHLYEFEFFNDEPTSTSLIKTGKEMNLSFCNKQIKENLENYYKETSSIIDNVLTNGHCIEKGIFKLRGLNIYDARYYNSFIVSNYFIMYECNDNLETKYTDSYFVIELNDNKNPLCIYYN